MCQHLVLTVGPPSTPFEQVTDVCQHRDIAHNQPIMTGTYYGPSLHYIRICDLYPGVHYACFNLIPPPPLQNSKPNSNTVSPPSPFLPPPPPPPEEISKNSNATHLHNSDQCPNTTTLNILLCGVQSYTLI